MLVAGLGSAAAQKSGGADDNGSGSGNGEQASAVGSGSSGKKKPLSLSALRGAVHAATKKAVALSHNGSAEVEKIAFVAPVAGGTHARSGRAGGRRTEGGRARERGSDAPGVADVRNGEGSETTRTEPNSTDPKTEPNTFVFCFPFLVLLSFVRDAARRARGVRPDAPPGRGRRGVERGAGNRRR